MSAFTMGKFHVATTRGQGLLPVSILAFLLQACGHDGRRTVLVEADTTGATWRSSEASPRAPGAAEIALLDAESLAWEGGPTDPPGPSGEESAGRASSRLAARGNTGRARPGRGSAVDPDRNAGVSADPAEAREQGARPPPPVLLPSGRVVLPAGIVLAAELRTPLHTATTVVGDRFAARLTQGVAAGGRVVIPVGALVEGRVSHVGTANEPGTIAFLQVEARSVRLPDGRRLPISADVLDVTGQEVVQPGRDRPRAGARAEYGAKLGGAAAEARRAMLGSILIGLAGRAIVAPMADREIIVPTGTTFTLELVEPLEVPAP